MATRAPTDEVLVIDPVDFAEAPVLPPVGTGALVVHDALDLPEVPEVGILPPVVRQKRDLHQC